MIGQTISHYQVVEKLGEGGMGVVFKARDTSLDRYVALKLLPGGKLKSPERKQRFIQEAKAASALNHPHIVTIYEIGEEDGYDFIVMEYVAGKTLDAFIPRNGMRLGEALKYAAQIADALAVAHAAGIIHRDIKPSNIMVGEDGRVRVLDFGLAKQAEQTLHASPEAPTITAAQAAPVTVEGTVLGTPNYMSPEQAQGLPIDTRSDIFSFGAVLYEMITGRRAFQGESALTTMAAIVQQEPEPLPVEVPLELRKVVERSLRKDPERRIRDLRDVGVTLEDLKEESDSGKLQSVSVSSQAERKRGLAWIALAAVATLVAAGWFFRSEPGIRIANEAEPPKPLTSFPGREDSPTFAPEGDRLAFAWEGPNRDNWDIYVKLIGQETPLRLTDSPLEDNYPAWSPDGRWIAFVRSDPTEGDQLMLVPSIGGPVRPLTDGLCGLRPHRITWHPDSEHVITVSQQDGESACQLAVVSLSSGTAATLTHGIETLTRPNHPALSPDRSRLAFGNHTSGRSGSIYLVDVTASVELTGKPRQVAAGRSPVWSPDGKHLFFRKYGGGATAYHRMTVDSGDAKPVVPMLVGTGLALSPNGSRAAFTRRDNNGANIWRFPLPDGKGAAPVISSSFLDSNATYSPDGTRIAFSSSRSGYREIWVAQDDGSNPMPLTFLESPISANPNWSPDGKRIAFDSQRGDERQILIVPSNGGEPVPVTHPPGSNSNPSWSTNGRWIYYFRSDGTYRGGIWKVPLDGGEPQQVTAEGIYGAESLDGRLLYVSSPFNGPGERLWSVPVGGGRPTELFTGLRHDQNFEITAGGIYYVRIDGRAIGYYDFETQAKREVIDLPSRAHFGISISPDGGDLIVPQQPDTLPESDLMLVENFR